MEIRITIVNDQQYRRAKYVEDHIIKFFTAKDDVKFVTYIDDVEVFCVLDPIPTHLNMDKVMNYIFTDEEIKND